MSPVRCRIEVDLSALLYNARVARESAGPDGRVLAVVKSNAYGLGAQRLARELATEAGVRDFGVACIAEARELRACLPAETEIVLLSPALPEEIEEAVALRLTPWISDADEVRAYASRANPQHPLDVVIEVDTGMGRTGVLPQGLPALVTAVRSERSLRLTGIATHPPSSDEEPFFTRAQFEQFERIEEANPPASPEFRFQSRNSAGILGYAPRPGEMVRAGLMLYGVSPLPEHQHRLRPVVSWKTRVTLVRELPIGHGVSYGRTFITTGPTRVATLAVGYGDGYRRSLAHRGTCVLLHGRRCPLLGRVTMDQIMVDVTALSSVAVGDEAVLIGRDGRDEITAAELAGKAETIPWEIFTGLSPRVARVYL